MELKEPKKKKRVRLQLQQPFPICLGNKNDGPVYTAHLSTFGSCIIQPDEIKAIHSMGFFGKGSLSRSFPSFGRSRYGAPPLVRNRQWDRRQEWLKALKEFNAESFLDDRWRGVAHTDSNREDNTDINSDMDEQMVEPNDGNKANAETSCERSNVPNELDGATQKVMERREIEIYDEVLINDVYTGHCEKSIEEGQCTNEVIDISEVDRDCVNIDGPRNTNDTVKSNDCQKKTLRRMDSKVDEVVLDSAEEDIYEVMNKEIEDYACRNDSKTNDIILLSDSKMEDASDMNSYFKCKDDDPNICKNEMNMQGTELLVLPDSDSEVENYLSNIEPRIESEGFPIREMLYLTFEETFFLMFGLGCLQIVNFDGNFLDIKDTWNYFCKEEKNFVQKYITYHYFRSKGWVVKPGLKYGGDFLLYKQGPPFYHASYIVIIEVVDADTLIKINNKTMRKMTWNTLFGLARLSETAAKEILFAQILWPSSIPQDSDSLTPDMLSEFTIREVLWRRWIPKQNRESNYLEDEDEDSL